MYGFMDKGMDGWMDIDLVYIINTTFNLHCTKR